MDLASKKEEISSSNSGESPASLGAPPGIVVDDTGFKRLLMMTDDISIVSRILVYKEKESESV